jgi:ferric-dicitrate binding protein FerR (iron transport regulator)
MPDTNEQDVRSSSDRWIGAQLLARFAFLEPEHWQSHGITEAVLARAFQWIFELREGSTSATELTFKLWLQLDAQHPVAYARAEEFSRMMQVINARDILRLRLDDEASG